MSRLKSAPPQMRSYEANASGIFPPPMLLTVSRKSSQAMYSTDRRSDLHRRVMRGCCNYLFMRLHDCLLNQIPIALTFSCIHSAIKPLALSSGEGGLSTLGNTKPLKVGSFRSCSPSKKSS